MGVGVGGGHSRIRLKKTGGISKYLVYSPTYTGTIVDDVA